MTEKDDQEKPQPAPASHQPPADRPEAVPPAPATSVPQEEVGGRDGPEPTRYGDWEVGGICTDF